MRGDAGSCARIGRASKSCAADRRQDGLATVAVRRHTPELTWTRGVCAIICVHMGKRTVAARDSQNIPAPRTNIGA